MTESESVALPLGDTPTSLRFDKNMGWVVGFEPTYTGATTLGLNHLTIPTMLVNFVHYCVVVSFVLGCVHRYAPFDTHSTRLVLRKIPCAYKSVNFVHCVVTVSLALGYVHRYVPFGAHSTRLALRKISCAYKSVHVSFFKKELATWNGLEPSTSSVTGWHSNQLNYQAANGGSYRARTYDPLLVRQMLSQLS